MKEKLVFDGRHDFDGRRKLLWDLHSAIGPDRGKRRPQELMELWVAISWIDSLPRDSAMKVRLLQRDRPDFRVEIGEDVFGLEITEAENTDERKWRRKQKHNNSKGPWYSFSPDMHPEDDMPDSIEYCIHSIQKKKRKLSGYSVKPCELLIYFNSMRLICSDIDEFKRELKRKADTVDSGFRRIWVHYDRTETFCLTNDSQ